MMLGCGSGGFVVDNLRFFEGGPSDLASRFSSGYVLVSVVLVHSFWFVMIGIELLGYRRLSKSQQSEPFRNLLEHTVPTLLSSGSSFGHRLDTVPSSRLMERSLWPLAAMRNADPSSLGRQVARH